MEMDTSEIQAAIDSIPAKKEDLRKAFEVLQSYSSSFSSFTLKWNDLDGHVSFIEKSIEERFRELEAKVRSCVADKPAAAAMVAAERKVVEKEPEIKVQNKVVEKEPEVKSVLELKDFCVRMDGKGLRSYILKNRKLLPEFRDELRLALRAAPNPIMLVLDSLDGFVPSRKVKKKELELIWKTCVHLVQVLHELALEIKASYRERARRFATEWRGKITDGEGNNWFVVLGFLHLVVTFGLVDSFAANDILDVLVLVARRRQIVDMCRSLGFEDKMHDFIDKLKKKGKEVDAVKFVLAFNLSEKHPPASLLESYVNTIKKAAFEQRQKAKSTQIKVCF
ncbi:Protein FRIGIDA [Apostasia shenzhenica]|uniref:FRIGIDA-like protein n=1 Tax=Apostasia shenzhenica TaxID=1088818 RepID=A0A2I0ADH6_9ASPA|nr:Protein FRIGIDA [Apostasia shenzhenica]